MRKRDSYYHFTEEKNATPRGLTSVNTQHPILNEEVLFLLSLVTMLKLLYVFKMTVNLLAIVRLNIKLYLQNVNQK